MLNNKGLVVSTVLYTILIALLLFLGVTLAYFSVSNKLLSSSTEDLINGAVIEAKQIYEIYDENSFEIEENYNSDVHSCGKGYMWYQALEKNEVGYVADADGDKEIDVIQSNLIVRINTRYGTFYWPRDFKNGTDEIKIEVGDINILSKNKSVNNKISVEFNDLTSGYDDGNGYVISSLSGYGSIHYGALIFKDNSNEEKTHVIITDVCKTN